MKAFISYSHNDQKFAQRLSKALKAAGIDIWMDSFELRPGDNLFESIQQGLRECDIILPILSPDYVGSKWAMRELNAFFMRELSQEEASIIPLFYKDCDIPVFLRDKVYVDFRSDFETAVQRLIDGLLHRERPSRLETVPPEVTADRKQTSLDFHISKIRKHLHNGELTLVCGAGVSVAAGVPEWATLLDDLLSSLFGKKLSDATIAAKEQMAELYQEFFNPSPIVVAQYLKNGLGKDFLPSIRSALYRNSPTSSVLVDAIVDLCRPQRSRESLSSIISFNFDDLIEHNLKIQHIEHRPIFAEGQKAGRSELPIFHVHGYLPRDGEVNENHGIVFSEDAYHSQFIDPFSWSNLVQLNHFSKNVCLFLGLSMTDPNLRRLLDVSMRKNPERTANHYVFKRRYDPALLQKKFATLSIEGDESINASDFIKISQLLEEQDGSNLGLNTIWVDDYSEIPRVLKAIADMV